MELSKKVAMNTLAHVGGKAASVAIGVAVIAMMTRSLGAEGFGYYSTVVAFLQIFGILVDFGLTLTHTQLLAEPGANKERIVGAMLGLRMLSAILFLALAPIVGMFFPYPLDVKLGIAILSASFFFISINQILLGIFQNALQMQRIATAELIGRVALLIGTALAIWFEQSLLVLLAVITLGSIITTAATVWLARDLVRIRPFFDRALSKKFLWLSWPVGLSIAFNLLYLKGDTIILSLYRSAEDVGYYGAPFRVLEILISFAFIFVGIIFPILRANWLTDRPRFARQLQRSFDALALVTFPLVAGGVVLGKPIMTFVAGTDFAPSGPLMQILTLAVGFIFFGTLFGHIIVAIGRQKQMLWGYGLTALLALIGYLYFIPLYGALGAAWMTVAAEGLMTIILAVTVLRTTRVHLRGMIAGKATLASIVMAIALLLLPTLHVLFLLVIGIIVYAVLLLLLRAITTKEFHSLFITSRL